MAVGKPFMSGDVLRVIVVNVTNDSSRPQTGHCVIRLVQKIMTGHLPNKPESLVKNQTPGNYNRCNFAMKSTTSYWVVTQLVYLKQAFVSNRGVARTLTSY